jgi:hypothetical protein
VYEDDNGKSVTVTDLKEVCSVFFNRSYEQMQEDLKNLEMFGQEFLESAQNMELGYRDLRKLRKLPNETQELIINSEAVDLSDKDAVKELIEDMSFKHVTEKKELETKLEDTKANLSVAREMTSEKQAEVNAYQEKDAKRRMSQEPWKDETLDSVNAMIEARALITEGINQLTDSLNNLSENHNIDDKAMELIAKSLLTEVKYNSQLFAELTNDAFSMLGSKYSPDLPVDDLYNQLHNDSDNVLPAE